jgi:8-oxo-dGTP pyrophosphatase MutT (NUDIX family)
LKDATLIFVTRDTPTRQVLLGYKKTGFGAGKLNGFGGKIETGETARAAAVRELREEASIHVLETDAEPVAHLTFWFPAQPDWNQIVHVFLARQWSGKPVESREMIPQWVDANAIPFDRMWQDDFLWLPRVLDGEKLQAQFTFGSDNEQVTDYSILKWNDTNL